MASTNVGQDNPFSIRAPALQMPPGMPTGVVHPYGSGATAPAQNVPAHGGPLIGGNLGITPPAPPKARQTTRRDREERSADRARPRNQHEAERAQVESDGLDSRIQLRITRLLACETSDRTVSREFTALRACPCD